MFLTGLLERNFDKNKGGGSLSAHLCNGLMCETDTSLSRNNSWVIFFFFRAGR